MVSAFSFALGNYTSTIIGGLMAQFSSIFDGCDGEVARLKHQTSDYGAWLDAVLDRYADAAIILGMAYGLWHLEGNNAFLFVGYFALIGSFITSYTATKYDSLIRARQRVATWRFGRDTRLLLIMLGAILNEIYFLLLTLAFITNFISIRRLLIFRKV
jgi:CDP-L-myo-inositol myo-inositolphosphotransferase